MKRDIMRRFWDATEQLFEESQGLVATARIDEGGPRLEHFQAYRLDGNPLTLTKRQVLAICLNGTTDQDEAKLHYVKPETIHLIREGKIFNNLPTPAIAGPCTLEQETAEVQTRWRGKQWKGLE